PPPTPLLIDCGTSDDVIAVYIGDDTTDEDAFKVLRTRKDGNGVAIRVSNTYKGKGSTHSSATTLTLSSSTSTSSSAVTTSAVPVVMTLAEFTLRSIEQVEDFLSRLCTI